MSSVTNLLYTDHQIELDGTDFAVRLKLPALLELNTNGKLDSINGIATFPHDENIEISVNVSNERFEGTHVDMGVAMSESIKHISMFREELAFLNNISINDVFATPKEITYKFLLNRVQMLASQYYFYALGELYCVGTFTAFFMVDDEIYRFIVNLSSMVKREIDVDNTMLDELSVLDNETFDAIAESIDFAFIED